MNNNTTIKIKEINMSKFLVILALMITLNINEAASTDISDAYTTGFMSNGKFIPVKGSRIVAIAPASYGISTTKMIIEYEGSFYFLKYSHDMLQKRVIESYGPLTPDELAFYINYISNQ
jgi:hypothetical protein